MATEELGYWEDVPRSSDLERLSLWPALPWSSQRHGTQVSFLWGSVPLHPGLPWGSGFLAAVSPKEKRQ